ncbi:hypothetical protein X801_03899 [Opisthorchis viverrini]|uniref:Uncharacterized protein n=1 Tax=Opisthorchis viverrini TaxID=6198 RepID=A0A1S8X148_OPIVI|nr:hypothetical protein X801_03899 [Opisthorchis viverrini]
MNHDSTRQDGLFAMAYLVITYPMFSLRYLDSLIASMVPSKQRDCIRANEILSKSWWTSTIFFRWCIGPVATLVHSKVCWRIPKFSASVLQLCLSNCGPGYVVGKMILLEKVSAIKKDLIVLNQVRAKFHVNSNDVKLYEPPFRCSWDYRELSKTITGSHHKDHPAGQCCRPDACEPLFSRAGPLVL